MKQVPWDEFGAIMRDLRLERRAARIARLPADLAASDVVVVRNFSETHWHVRVSKTDFDFWPTTGRWRIRRRPVDPLVSTGGIRAMRKAATALEEPE